MAVNNSTLQDEDGSFSDWVEIHNPDGIALNLNGWYLTDDAANLTKWTFPSVVIPPGGFLTVFASDKNRAVTGAELHTSFKLSAVGEALALTMPDGVTVTSAFDPYPPQVADVAYGMSFSQQLTTVLGARTSLKVHVPDAISGAAMIDDWMLPDYIEGTNGETWSSATSGVGFGAGFNSLIGTDGNLAGQMLNSKTGAFVRIEFSVENAAEVDALSLRMKYDDGFVAYLNGEEVVRSNAPGAGGAQSPETGLVALWDFDGDLDDDAGDFTNSSGIASDDLSPTGAAAYQTGIAGQAVRITSAGLQRLRAPDSNDLDLGQNWTLEAFVKPDSNNTGEWDRFWTKWGDGGNEFHLTFRSTGAVTVNNGIDLFINGSNNILNSNNTASVPLNVWSHIAVVSDQSAGAITAWLNGTQVGSAPWQAVTPTAGAMNFGNFESPGNVLQYSGLIDEAAIWKVALTSAQLASHAAAISGSPSNSAEAYGLTPTDGGGGGELSWDSAAATDRLDTEALSFETFPLTSRLDLLETGTNVLAIHGLNVSSASDDFLILPEIDVANMTVESGTAGYLPTPTPGAANQASTASIGPIFGPSAHTPAEPGNGDPIVVTVPVIETLNPIGSVTLTYRTGYGGSTNTAMNDAGTGADATAGDGVYSAAIPAAASGPGDMLRWKITATDTTSDSTTAPAFTDPLGSPEYFGTVISDPATSSALPILHWFVQNTGAAETGSGTHASVFYRGEFFDNVFVRIRGDTARSWPKKSYKIDFNSGHHFRIDPDLPRVDEININTTYTDKSFVRTVLAYESFRDAGSPHSIAYPFRLEQNGSFYSVAILVEQPDRDYLRRNGLDDKGALYKASANSIQGINAAAATSGIEKKNRKEENFSDLQTLINSLALNGSALNNYLFDHVDVPAVVNNMATNIVIQNIDRTVKNFYLYRDSDGTGEWMFFPWDVDLSFGPNELNTNTIVSSEDTGNRSSHPFMGTQAFPFHSSGLWNGLLDAIIDRPDTRAMFLRRLRTLGDGFLNTTYYENRIDALVADLTQDAALDRARWGSSGNFNGTTLSLLGETNRIKNEYLVGRRTHLFVTHASVGGGAVLLPESSTVTAFVPVDASLGDTWKTTSFNDSSWLSGTNAVGYERGASQDYTPLLGIDLLSPSIPAAQRIDADGNGINDNNSCYLRYVFNIADKSAVNFLKLRVKYDDGFVAFLNGVRVARVNDPNPLNWNAEASTQHNDSLAISFVDFDISAFKGNLLNGTNVLAVQAMNNGSTSSDMLFSCELLDEAPGGSSGVGIPPSQPLVSPLTFGAIEFNPASGNQDEEFIELTNPNNYAVDVSNWTVTGGVTMTLKPGTVIPSGGSLFLSPDVTAFRARATSPTGGEGRFVQGKFSGHLSNFGETLMLTDSLGTQVAQTVTTAAPSDVQRFLVVSEFHYHPAGDPGEEFIELMNISDSVPLDLTNVKLVSGVTFSLSGNLAPGARLLIVRDQAAFEAKYGTGLPIAGEFENPTNLNNDGETIKIDDASNSTVKEFTYNDKSPWAEVADGLGPSLVLINPASNPNPDIATNWRPSTLPGGNPGGTDSATFSGDPNADLNSNGMPDLVDHALLGGSLPVLTVSGNTITFEFVANLSADDAGLSIEISTDLTTWNDGATLFSLTQSEYTGNGGQKMTFQADASGISEPLFFVRLRAVMH